MISEKKLNNTFDDVHTSKDRFKTISEKKAKTKLLSFEKWGILKFCNFVRKAETENSQLSCSTAKWEEFQKEG
jgi:hypothetical protein